MSDERKVPQQGDPGDEQSQRCAFTKNGRQCVYELHHAGQHETEGLPYFCYTPNECAGQTCCRKNPACSE